MTASVLLNLITGLVGHLDRTKIQSHQNFPRAVFFRKWKSAIAGSEQ